MMRLDIYLVALDPAIGSEMRTSRPAIIVSPDEMNQQMNTVTVVPLTSGKLYPFRIATRFRGKQGAAAIDQVRTLDKTRLVKRLGTIDAPTGLRILDALVEMFAA